MSMSESHYDKRNFANVLATYQDKNDRHRNNQILEHELNSIPVIVRY